MTTAYTSLLGLALPVTGELSGTWGDTVNNSITSLLDSAISGTTTLSTDADITLSTTTGAANESREAILLWTAGGTVTRNITAPAQSKTYIVINASSSTQSIVLRGVGPTTGVTIVKGESAVCAWNGSDFIKVANTSGAGSFTSLTATGTATFSGNVSMTSSSFTRTATTQAWLDGSMTTAAWTVGGTTQTGAITLGRSTGAQTLNLATGATLASTTKAINIGTTGVSTSVTNITSGSSVAGALVTHTWNAGANSMTLDSSGNVGIGTSSPGELLHIYKASGDPAFRIQSSAGNCYVVNRASTSTMDLLNAMNGPMTFATNNTEKMRIDSAGNLCIGTTTAYDPLSVAGSIAPAATPSTSWGIDFASSVTPPNYTTLAAAATYDLAVGSGIVVIHNDGNGDGAVFFTYGGNTIKIGGAASIVAGVGVLSQIGLTYNSGTGKYRINNGYVTSQSIFITTIRTRTSS